MLGEVRTIFAMVIGAAACLVVIGVIALVAGRGDPVPSVIAPILVIIGVVGDLLTRRRAAQAAEDLELAIRNSVRAEVAGSASVTAASGVQR